jgi:hypothetical protein
VPEVDRGSDHSAHDDTGSTRVRVMVSGTPTAAALDPPRLARMSLRTMPEIASAFGPFEPSPG